MNLEDINLHPLDLLRIGFYELQLSALAALKIQNLSRADQVLLPVLVLVLVLVQRIHVRLALKKFQIWSVYIE